MRLRNAVITAALLFSLAGTAGLAAQQTDDNGQVVNPQPHTKHPYNEEKKDMKHQLKHNRKADKAAAKAGRNADKAARNQQKANAEAEKANTPLHSRRSSE